MAKGDIAKSAVIEKIKTAFGDDYVGIVDKKIYVWAKEGAERIQIAISLVATKNPVSIGGEPLKTGDLDFGGGMDFEAMGSGKVIESKPAEITPEEVKNIEDLFARLGL